MSSPSKFLLSEESRSGAVRLSVEHIADSWGIFLGENVPKEAVVFRYDRGKTPFDFVFSDMSCLFVVSGRVVKLFEHEGVTGCSYYPVKFSGHKLGDLAECGYCGLSVVGRCGELDFARSKRVILPPLGESSRPVAARLGYCFAEETWDGTDVFCPNGMTAIIVSKRVRELFALVDVTNAKLQPLEDVTRY